MIRRTCLVADTFAVFLVQFVIGWALLVTLTGTVLFIQPVICRTIFVADTFAVFLVQFVIGWALLLTLTGTVILIKPVI